MGGGRDRYHPKMLSFMHTLSASSLLVRLPKLFGKKSPWCG